MANEQTLDVKSPTISNAYGEPLLRRKRAVRTTQTACTELQLTLRDDCGSPVDLTDYAFLASSNSSSSSAGDADDLPYVQTRFREASLMGTKLFSTAATVVTPETGVVKATIPADGVMSQAGIWLAEFGVFNADDNLLFSNECYIYNELSAWGDSSKVGPPAVDHLRLSLRDSDPVINELIDNYDFDLAELCHAALRSVQFWNDQPPPVRGALYSTITFPFREIWLTGIHYYLFLIAEEHYRRNHFKHQAGGTMIDDKNRHHEYGQAMQSRYAEWRRMVMHRKAQLNVENAYGTLRSGYDLYQSSAIGGSGW